MWKDELVEILFSSDPSKLNVEKAIDLKYTNTPSSLCKYKSFEDRHSLELLKTDEMWLSRPTNFNDPFDCAYKLAVKDLPKEYIIKVLLEPNLNNLKQNFNITYKEFNKSKRKEDPIHELCKIIVKK